MPAPPPAPIASAPRPGPAAPGPSGTAPASAPRAGRVERRAETPRLADGRTPWGALTGAGGAPAARSLARVPPPPPPPPRRRRAVRLRFEDGTEVDLPDDPSTRSRVAYLMRVILPPPPPP